jgi:transposase-like protein
MYQVKDLTALTLKDLWREVKSEEDWWGEINERVLGMVKLILESSLEEELLAELQVRRYQRSRQRTGYRNGYYPRDLYTTFGVIKSLRVPRARERHDCRILPRYQRRQDEINEMVRNMFLAGVSTRRVGEILAKIGGEKISAQTVSRIAQSLDAEVDRFHRQSLSDSYQYLLLDGICLKVKEAGTVHKRQVLCAYGITWEGKKAILSFRQASCESAVQWEAFLRDLYDRGLEGKPLRLIVTDGCPGLHAALEIVYPYIARQRCWVHKLRNVTNQIRKRDVAECLAGARLIYQAKHKRAAIKGFQQWQLRWEKLYPKAVNSIAKDLDELLNFMDMPPEHRIKVRTTNAIERAFREVRRRIRPMSCFTNAHSVDRIIYGVVNHLNASWKEKPFVQFTQNY